MSKKRILITGSFGFIGSHLVDKFLSNGFCVFGMDNFSTGSRDNLAHVNNPDFEWQEWDVSNFLAPYYEFDYIIHAASPASPITYGRLPIETIKANVQGTWNCLGFGRYKKARVILISTSEIYGDALVHPQHEDYYGNTSCTNIRSCYDESKRLAETLMVWYKKVHGLNTGIVRLFNTFGERMDINDGRAVPQFFKQAILGEDITIFGDGSQTRSLGYVSDIVDGIYRYTLSDFHSPINLGNPDEVTIGKLAKEIIEITGSSSQITYSPLPQDDPKQRCPDTTLAKKALGWQPKVSRWEGLLKTYEYFKRKLDAAYPPIY